jgi:hypothetical protein
LILSFIVSLLRVSGARKDVVLYVVSEHLGQAVVVSGGGAEEDDNYLGNTVNQPFPTTCLPDEIMR